MKHEENGTALAQRAMTPADLIERAAAANASMEQMQQLFELKLRVEADEARKAFNAAMAQFKADPPKISKNKDVEYGQTKYSHATLDHVVDTITPALAKVGIRHRWDVDQSVQGLATVTCVLSHELGHSEATKITAGYDTSGSKNGIQAIGSTITYLQRYTLLAATGLAAGTDDDGRGAEDGPTMPEPELVAHLDAIRGARDENELKTFFAAAYKDAKKIGDKSAQADFIKAKDQRKGEL